MFENDYFRISPTAKLIAYSRQFSDIPFAKEIAEITESEKTCKELFSGLEDENHSLNQLVIFAEARYKSMLNAIQKFQLQQVLEFASGLTFRGVAIASKFSGIYVETDLPGMMEEKQKVLSHLPHMQKEMSRGNIFYHSVNIFNFDEIEKALNHFVPHKPLAIIHEGLFQYFSMKEKREAALNIKKILQRFGGVWITPDFICKDEVEKSEEEQKIFSRFAEVLSEATQRDLANYIFENEDELNRFFYDLGFNVEVWPQLDEQIELSCLKKMAIPNDYLQTIAPHLKLWSLTLRH